MRALPRIAAGASSRSDLPPRDGALPGDHLLALFCTRDAGRIADAFKRRQPRGGFSIVSLAAFDELNDLIVDASVSDEKIDGYRSDEALLKEWGALVEGIARAEKNGDEKRKQLLHAKLNIIRHECWLRELPAPRRGERAQKVAAPSNGATH